MNLNDPMLAVTAAVHWVYDQDDTRSSSATRRCMSLQLAGPVSDDFERLGPIGPVTLVARGVERNFAGTRWAEGNDEEIVFVGEDLTQFPMQSLQRIRIQPNTKHAVLNPGAVAFESFRGFSQPFRIADVVGDEMPMFHRAPCSRPYYGLLCP